MNLSKLFLYASLLAGLGGWMITLQSWSAALTPVSIGGLLVVEAGVVCAWLGKSPLKSINDKG